MSALMPSRRGLLAASAWSVPAVVVASAAPAFATSGLPGCVPVAYRVNWDSDGYQFSTEEGRGAVMAVKESALPSNAAEEPLMLEVSSVFAGSLRAAAAGSGAERISNLEVSQRNVGGLGHRGLAVVQEATSDRIPQPRSASAQTVTLSFSREVRDLRFEITDVDRMLPGWGEGQFQDRVWMDPRPSSGAYDSGRLTGAGTEGDPWRGRFLTDNVDHFGDGRNNVVVSYQGHSARQFRLTFWNDESRRLTGRGLQGIFLSNLSFTASSC